MNAYSKDLRLKTLAAIDRGIPRKEVAELFGVSRSTIKRWLNRRRQTGDVQTMKIPGRPSVKGQALREWLLEVITHLSCARLVWPPLGWLHRSLKSRGFYNLLQARSFPYIPSGARLVECERSRGARLPAKA